MSEPTMPNIDAILARIVERKEKDYFGFELEEYIEGLPFAQAKPYLKPGATEAEWEKYRAKSRAEVIAKMKDYMPFAWEKANDCRGLSANRSIMHYIGWTWMAGDADLSTAIDNEFMDNYRYYGKEILTKICEHYKWDPKQWDDGHRMDS